MCIILIQEEMERSELSSLKRFQDPLSCDVPSKRVKELSDGNVCQIKYCYSAFIDNDVVVVVVQTSHLECYFFKIVAFRCKTAGLWFVHGFQKSP